MWRLTALWLLIVLCQTQLWNPRDCNNIDAHQVYIVYLVVMRVEDTHEIT